MDNWTTNVSDIQINKTIFIYEQTLEDVSFIYKMTVILPQLENTNQIFKT